MTMRPTAIIIGAGVGGLATASILAKQGYKVTVYEKNHQVGGRMGLLETHGYRFDTGPSWYLMADVYEQYFRLIGERMEDYYALQRLSPSYKVFYDYRGPLTITGNLQKDCHTFDKIEPGSGKKLRDYVAKAEINYKLALQHFLYNPFRSPNGLVSPTILKKTPEFVKLFARPLHTYVRRYFKALPLQQILEYPTVFLGTSPYQAPALYQLMSYLDFKEGVFYPKGGLYKIPEALYAIGQKLGVTYRFNKPVDKILTRSGKAEGVRVAGKDVLADVIISNADLHFTETKLLKPAERSYPESYWQRRSPGPSAMLLYLGIRGSLPELEHHNLFFVKDWKTNFDNIYKTHTWPEQASMYVCRPSASDATVAPKGHENLFVLVPLPAGVSKSTAETNKFTDRYLQQLEQMTGISDLRTRITVKEFRDPAHFGEAFHAWQNGALGMSHTLRQSAFLRPSIKSKKLQNLYYVGGGTQPGIGVPMCLISAQLVYKSIIGDTSPGPLSSLGDMQP